jgi:hypothetical protein
MVLLIFCVIAVVVLSPISFTESMPNLFDMLNHFAAISQAKLAFSEGQFPLRVMPLEVSGWRYPFYQFYSSSSYIFAGMIYKWLVPASVYSAYKIALWCALVAGGFYMYRLADWVVDSRPAAILSGVAYMLSPYVLLLVNHMGAFNEALAVGILPVVLYYTLQCYHSPFKLKPGLQASFFWYLLITVHSITFVNATWAIFLLILVGVLQDFRRWKNFLFVALAYCFSCVLAVWCLAPTLLLIKFLKVQDTLAFITESVLQLSLSNLLSPAANISGGIFGDGHVSLSSEIHPSLGIPFVFAAGVCLYAIFTRNKLNRERADFWLLPLLCVFFTAVFLAWSPINIWKWLSGPFTVLQYPWRVLSQLIWAGALLLAWAVCWLFRGKVREGHAVVGVVLILFMASTWFPLTERSFWPLKDLPKTFLLVPDQDVYSMQAKRFPFYINSVKGNSFLDVKQMQPLCTQHKIDTVCELMAPKNLRLIELPVLYYPQLLQVHLNGRSVPYMAVLYKNRLMTAIEPEAGKANKIEIRFTGLVWANKVSLCAWILWGLGLMYCLASQARRLFLSRNP